MGVRLIVCHATVRRTPTYHAEGPEGLDQRGEMGEIDSKRIDELFSECELQERH
jgi:hypothetical protein